LIIQEVDMLKQFFANALLAILIFQPGTSPGPRSGACLIYSPVRKTLLLIDGYSIHPADGKSVVFEWKNNEWHLIPAEGPATKGLSSGDCNSDINAIVIFGGVGKNGYSDRHNDTWMFVESGWKKIETNDIGTRDHHRMVYDRAIHSFVLYGGQSGEHKPDTTTWLLDGNAWRGLKLAGPGIRYHFGMCYDPVREKVVLFGGVTDSSLQGDTWEFDGKQWDLVSTGGPGPRSRVAMCYDAGRKMVLLYGGDNGKRKVDSTLSANGELWNVHGDLWGWNGKKWTLINNNGPQRMMAAMSYDVNRSTIVLYGGGDENQYTHADTWELENNSWKKLNDGGTWHWDGKGFSKI
jgi:hypothetical protein